MSVADQQYSVLLLDSPGSKPTVWTTTKRTVVLPNFLLLDRIELFFSPFLSCLSLIFLLTYELVCSFWKDNAKAHESTIFFFIFSLLLFCLGLRLKQNGPLKIPAHVLSQSPGFLIMVSTRPSHLDFSPTETRTWRS